LPKTVASNLQALGFTTPLEAQNRTIPIILAGDDTIIHSHTGTGKTLAFVLPILAQVLSDTLRDNKTKFVNNTLILVPTRELGSQIETLIRSLVKDMYLKQTKEQIGETLVQTLYSGDETVEQQLLEYEKKKPSIIIATPKRFVEIIDLNKKPKETSSEIQEIKPKERNFKSIPKVPPTPRISPEIATKAFQMVQSIKTVVLDEADQLLRPLGKYASLSEKEVRDKHPRPAALALKSVLAHSRGAQLICSSATINRPLINELYMLGFKHPTQLDLVKEYTVPENIKHYYALAKDKSNKFNKLCSVYTSKCDSKPALVVIDGHDSVDNFAANLQKYGSFEKEILLICKGIEARALHREMGFQKDEKLRNKVKEEFLGGKISLLVGTEDSIRGLDFLSLEYVFNLVVPRDPNSYIHIAGRSGRMQKPGTVFNVVTTEELTKLDRLGMYLKLDINNLSYE
jgi:ATP-dependent RNA helicase DeaD